MVNLNLVAIILGTLIEWSEFCFYGYLAFKFANLFFPNNLHSIAILLSFATFAISYISRPIGSIIFGYVGDKFGRKLALSISILLMGIATLGIGITPSYIYIGYYAPILLIIFRILQGIAMAGEFSGAAIFIAEDYLGPYKNLMVSIISMVSATGMLVGALAATIVSMYPNSLFAWRIPFMLGGVGCFIGLYLRNKGQDSYEFVQSRINSQQYTTAQATDLLQNTHNKKSIIFNFTRCFFIASFVGVYIYICSIWLSNYLIEQQIYSAQKSHWFATVGILLVVIFTPIAGFVADKITEEKLLRFGFLSSLITVPLIFKLAMSGIESRAYIAQVLYMITNVCVTAPMFYYLSKCLVVKVRFRTITIAWSLAVAIFGGTAPLTAQLLSSSHYGISAIIAYIISFGIINLLII